MTDKLKSCEFFVCPVKLSFYCVHRNLRETTKWCVFQEKTWINNYIFFPYPFALWVISFYIDIIGYNVCERVKNEKNSASIRYTFASFVRCLQDVRIICNGICKRSEHS